MIDQLIRIGQVRAQVDQVIAGVIAVLQRRLGRVRHAVHIPEHTAIGTKLVVGHILVIRDGARMAKRDGMGVVLTEGEFTLGQIGRCVERAISDLGPVTSGQVVLITDGVVQQKLGLFRRHPRKVGRADFGIAVRAVFEGLRTGKAQLAVGEIRRILGFKLYNTTNNTRAIGKAADRAAQDFDLAVEHRVGEQLRSDPVQFFGPDTCTINLDGDLLVCSECRVRAEATDVDTGPLRYGAIHQRYTGNDVNQLGHRAGLPILNFLFIHNGTRQSRAKAEVALTDRQNQRAKKSGFFLCCDEGRQRQANKRGRTAQKMSKHKRHPFAS